MTNRVHAIRTINDHCRKNFLDCAVTMTVAVQTLTDMERAQLLKAVRSFESFDEGNDPHNEHDFGAIEMFGLKWFWKFDYYDESLRFRSEDPSDSEKTRRVMTIMRSDEY